MSEERKMILQMVADGKISADEADMLLQAIEETERSARTAAAGESTTRSTDRGHAAEDFADSVERVVEQSLRGLDDTLRKLEGKLERKLEHRFGHDPGHEIRLRVEEKARRAAEKAVEQANRAAERAAERAQRIAERERERAERERERAERGSSSFVGVGGFGNFTKGETFFKFGVSIDQVTHEETQSLTETVQAGDTLHLENRVGDIDLMFYDGDQIEVTAHKTVWGQDQADAQERAAATRVEIRREGADVIVSTIRPSITAVGVVVIKDTRINYALRVPHGTNLKLKSKAGDLRVYARDRIGVWTLESKVGDIEAAVAREAGFTYSLKTTIGSLHVDLDGQQQGGATATTGTAGDGTGQITLVTKTGDIKLHY